MRMCWSCWPSSSRAKRFKRSWICWLRAGEKRRKRTRAKTLDGDKGAIIHLVVAISIRERLWSFPHVGAGGGEFCDGELTLIDYSGPKYEWAITPVLAKRLVSNCDTNLLMTISTFEETAVLSVALSRCDLRRHCLHKSLVDHSFTTDERGNNGDCTSRKFWKERYSEQKRLKTSRNYYKNH